MVQKTEVEKSKELVKALEKELKGYVYPVRVLAWPPTEVPVRETPASKFFDEKKKKK